MFVKDFHCQNLKKEDKLKYLHWRCWFTLFGKRIRFEICRQWAFSAKLRLNKNDGDITISASPIFFSFWLSIENVLSYSKSGFYESDREYGFILYDEYFGVYINSKTMSWSSTDPWWQKITINWKELIFGKHIFEKQEIGKSEAILSLPEADYNLNITFYKCVWSKSRWNRWPLRKESIMADIVPGVPVIKPGKGENSWDCGDDAIHSMWTNASTVKDAVDSFYKSVANDRNQYGSGINMYRKNS